MNFQPHFGEYGPYFQNFTKMMFFTWINKHMICKLDLFYLRPNLPIISGELLYKFKRKLNALSCDLMIGFRWTFFYFVILSEFFKTKKKDIRNWTGILQDNCKKRFLQVNLPATGKNYGLRLSYDISVQFWISFFYFQEGTVSYN